MVVRFSNKFDEFAAVLTILKSIPSELSQRSILELLSYLGLHGVIGNTGPTGEKISCFSLFASLKELREIRGELGRDRSTYSTVRALKSTFGGMEVLTSLLGLIESYENAFDRGLLLGPVFFSVCSVLELELELITG